MNAQKICQRETSGNVSYVFLGTAFSDSTHRGISHRERILWLTCTTFCRRVCSISRLFNFLTADVFTIAKLFENFCATSLGDRSILRNWKKFFTRNIPVFACLVKGVSNIGNKFAIFSQAEKLHERHRKNRNFSFSTYKREVLDISGWCIPMINGTLYIVIVSEIRQFTLVFYHHYKMEGRRQTRMASGVEEKEREKKANELNLPVNRCPLLFPFCSSPSKRASGYASLSCFLSSCSSREATLINEQYAGCFFEMPFSCRRLFSRLISARSCRFNLSA